MYSMPDNIGVHGFVDDHALKDSFKPVIDEIDKIIGLEECLWDFKIWMDSNRLKTNEAGIEFLLCSSRQQIPKCITSSLRVYAIVVGLIKTFLSNIKSLLSAKKL